MASVSTQKFYVYRHIRLDTEQPFYVGKGINRRAFYKYDRNPRWLNIVKSVDYKIEIVKFFDNEEEAYAFETKLIILYKKQGLCESNYTVGGWGGTPRKHTDEIIQQIRNTIKSTGALSRENNPKYKTEAKNDKILELYNSKIKPCDIARMLGVATSTVHRRIKWFQSDLKRFGKVIVCIEDGLIHNSIKGAAKYYDIDPKIIRHSLKGMKKDPNRVKVKLSFKYYING